MIKLLLIFVVILFSVVNAAAQLTEYPDFKICLEKHLRAIERRFLDGIRATVSDSVTLIFPNGEVLKSKQSFMDFHKEWFADPTWDISFNVLSVVETDELAYAFVKYRSERQNADGAPKSHSQAYLLLIFEKEDDVWKLVHDQNTSIANAD